MPVSPRWDARLDLWTITTTDRFDLDEVADLIEATDWGDARRYLWDLRELGQGPDSPTELERAVGLVERGRELWGGSRVALLVAREVDFGIARMFQAFAASVNVDYRVFRDEAAALAWLGVSGEATPGG